MKEISIYPNEKRAALSLAGIFAVRMLGLFMVLPVLSLYAHQLRGATPVLIGLAMGSYGLTQACLQLPFGILSDKIGRKSVITAGLVLFILGSIVCAMSHSIQGIIIGRALQGAGAIGATIIALIADLTREETRTKAMAVVGTTIGLSFAIAMVLGPTLNAIIGVAGIFWLTAVLGTVAIVILFAVVPKPSHLAFHRDAQALPALLLKNITNCELLRLDFGIFSLHAILTALFVVLPVLLQHVAHLPVHRQWLLYLPVLVLAFITMVPLIIIAEKKRRMKSVFIYAILTIGLSQIALWQWHTHYVSLALCLYAFFTAFILLEASLPSLISKIAPAGSKGTAMGIYSSAQFLGIFVGGSVAGILYGYHHVNSVFLITGLLAIIWLISAIRMQSVPYLATFMLNVGTMPVKQAQQLKQQILQIEGVADAVVISEEGVAYLKVDNLTVNRDKLLALSKNA